MVKGAHHVFVAVSLARKSSLRAYLPVRVTALGHGHGLRTQGLGCFHLLARPCAAGGAIDRGVVPAYGCAVGRPFSTRETSAHAAGIVRLRLCSIRGSHPPAQQREPLFRMVGVGRTFLRASEVRCTACLGPHPAALFRGSIRCHAGSGQMTAVRTQRRPRHRGSRPAWYVTRSTGMSTIRQGHRIKATAKMKAIPPVETGTTVHGEKIEAADGLPVRGLRHARPSGRAVAAGVT